MRLASLRRRTSFRLALTFGLLFVGTFVLSGGIIYHMLRLGLAEQLDASLHETYSVVSSAYAGNDLEDLVTTLDTYASLQPAGHGIYSLTDANGKRLAGNFTAPWLPEGTFTLGSKDIGLTGEGKYRVAVFKLGTNILVIGQSFCQMGNLLRIVLVGLAWAATVVVLAAIGGGVFLAARAQRRLDALAHTMFDVSNGRLDTRVPLRGNDDDLDIVSGQINSALDRLSGLIEGMRQVSSDIAHELKTPLNRLTMTLEEAIALHEEGRDPGALMEEARTESDQINATFEALLRISQIEAGARRQSFAPVNLREIFDLIEEIYVDVAEDNGQELKVKERVNAIILGDRELLTQMVVNLVENAIRHCPSGVTIEISLRREKEQVAILVADNGPGIPAQEQAKVFRRLYRLDKSRTISGNGLGLSLVKAIADLHYAQIKLCDREPGLCVAISVAIAPPSQGELDNLASG